MAEGHYFGKLIELDALPARKSQRKPWPPRSLRGELSPGVQTPGRIEVFLLETFHADLEEDQLVSRGANPWPN